MLASEGQQRYNIHTKNIEDNRMNSVPDRKGQGQPACQKEWKK